MASTKTNFAVGLFIIVGVAIGTASIIWLGMSSFFETGSLYISYFDESVQGLDKDSPVKYRGVTIGRVVNISVAPDGNLIQTLLQIDELKALEPDKLVAQLRSAGITGIMFIELDQQKGRPDQSPKTGFPSKYPVIHTKPSEIRAFITGVGDALDRINELDLAGISTRLKNTIDNLNQSITDLKLKQISEDLRTALNRAEEILDADKWMRIITVIDEAGAGFNRATARAEKAFGRLDTAVADINTVVNDNKENLGQALSRFNHSMAKAEDFMQEGIQVMSQADRDLYQLEQHLILTLRNLETASEHLEKFMETLSEQPSQLLFSEPQPSRQEAADSNKERR